MEPAGKTLGDDGHQSELQVVSPREWPEEEFLCALNGRRDGIGGRDSAHMSPFRGRHTVQETYADIMREVPQPGAELRDRHSDGYDSTPAKAVKKIGIRWLA